MARSDAGLGLDPAATMVTAGVYMIVRKVCSFELSPFSSNAVALVERRRLLFAATIAVGQYDIKKVLAYSTIQPAGFSWWRPPVSGPM